MLENSYFSFGIDCILKKNLTPLALKKMFPFVLIFNKPTRTIIRFPQETKYLLPFSLMKWKFWQREGRKESEFPKTDGKLGPSLLVRKYVFAQHTLLQYRDNSSLGFSRRKSH
jgi:hypothetical protein